MSSISSPYFPSRPVHVLHVIGLVGAGKTTFLRDYFPTLPVFDIQMVYRDHHFSPEDLKQNPTGYLQFSHALQIEWEGFLRDHDPQADIRVTFCVGVESSGINQALNSLLVPFFPTVLLIHGDSPPPSNTSFWETRPYGHALNTVLQAKCETKDLRYTHLYEVQTQQFTAPLPREFRALSPRLNGSILEIPRATRRNFQCPICHAPFSTEFLFQKHLHRHQSL